MASPLPPAPLEPLPLRLPPGTDLRRGIEEAIAARADADGRSAFVLSGIGSLSRAALRPAGAEAPLVLAEPLEVLTLGGSVGPDGAHLHATVSTATGRVLGGHVAPGCIVRTTAEVLLAVLPGWRLARAHDAATGHLELVVARA